MSQHTFYQCTTCCNNVDHKCSQDIAVFPVARACTQFRPKQTTTIAVVPTKHYEPVSAESFLYAKDDPKHCVFYSKLK